MRNLCLALFLLFAATSAHAVPPHSISISADMLSRFTRVEVTAKVHDSKPVVWSGVRLQELMAARFYSPFGDRLKGPWLAAVVRATGADGYQVVFTLSELDAAFGNLEVLVADRQDGKPIDPADGPVRLVVPSDKRAARWVRNLVRLEILELKE
jgi:DMSO/TMAO reductase YedYZ molybdopterin-dependent catalytic subunit